MGKIVTFEEFCEVGQATVKLFVALGGFTESDDSSFENFKNDLPDDYTLIVLNLPDHELICDEGGSFRSRLHLGKPLLWPDKLKEKLDRIYEANDGKPFSVFGYSVGAILIYDYVSLHPEKIGEFVFLACPPVKFRKWVGRLLNFVLHFDFSLKRFGSLLLLCFCVSWLFGNFHLMWFLIAIFIVPLCRYVFRFIPAPKSYESILELGLDDRYKHSVPLLVAARLLLLLRKCEKRAMKKPILGVDVLVIAGKDDSIIDAYDVCNWALSRSANFLQVDGGHDVLTKNWHEIGPLIKLALK